MNKIFKTVARLTTGIITRLTTGIVALEMSKITTADNNSRKTVNDTELQELAENIRQTGVLQPVLVRPKGKKYEIVYGERRFRASVLAGIRTIPAIIRKLSDDEAIEISLIENLIRKNIPPIEEAAAYKRLINTGHYDVTSLAVRFGKNETYIRNRMKLNDLTDDLLNLVDENALSVTAALELCKYSAEIQSDIYEKHLSGTGNCYDDWRNLSSREFITRVESVYCLDLNRYSFDKSECVKCTYNTGCYTLFPENGGRCNNLKCLTEKNEKTIQEKSNTGEVLNVVKTNDYIDLTQKQKQKQKLVQYYHNTHIIRYEYVQQEQSKTNGHLCFILDKETILCESSIKHIKEIAGKTKTTFTIELYQGNFIDYLNE
jgi:ParB family chromosome partitioning protein